jgi:putative DNA primase/helicase
MQTLHEAIPRDLQNLPQWVLYRVQARKGKTTKIPYQAARASRRASSTDPATWGTFEAAHDAHQRGRGDGIGFVFTPEDPYTGLDFDGCLHDGQLVPEAAPIVEPFDTYTETSPSGVGLHAIGRGQVGGGRRTSKTPWGGELEIYDRARYFTVTGQRFNGTPAGIADVTEPLAALMASLLPELGSPNGNGNGHAPLVLPDRLDDAAAAGSSSNAPTSSA